jgi:hypothetical protein
MIASNVSFPSKKIIEDNVTRGRIVCKVQGRAEPVKTEPLYQILKWAHV